MKNQYNAFPYGFDHVQITENGQLVAVASKEFSAKILAALKLYDQLQQEFLHLLPKEEEKEEIFVGLNSSWISKLSYRKSDGRVTLIKMDGGKITHTDVPNNVFLSVLRSLSVGEGYNKFIRGKFPKFERKGK